MSHISKPVDWEVFNIPSIQPVQYYSLLKKKREFSQLIKQYDAQVFKHGYLHYCGIVPKNISSSFNNRYEIVIVFFDEIPNTSFIGFRVKASEETFRYESNSLLLFLKKSEKAVFYLMNNNRIHVQCGTNAWELFYLLYDAYLRKYVLTIIGTQFFYHFVYSHCIKRETQLLELLYKGTKVIRIGKNSIYYKLHRKRKISVTDLIHMTINMPKSKRYIISCFSSKEPLLYSDSTNVDFYTAVGSKINVSKLVLTKFKKPFQRILPEGSKSFLTFQKMPTFSDSTFYSSSKCELLDKQLSCDTSLKRKFEEVESINHHVQPGPSTSKIFKISESSSIKVCENQWEQYQNLKPYAVKCYSDIPSISHLVPNLLKNGKSSHFVNSSNYLLNTDCNNVPMLPLTKLNEDNKKNGVPAIKEINHINSVSHTKSNNDSETEVITGNTFPFKSLRKPIHIETCVDSVTSKDVFPIPQNVEDSGRSHPFLDVTDSAHKVSVTLPNNTKSIDEDYSNIITDVGFTTAAGKNIKISDMAMLTANKLVQDTINDGNEEVLHEKVKCDLNKTGRKMTILSNYPNFRKKAVTNIPLAKISENTSYHGIKIKNNETPPKKLETTFSSNVDKNIRLESFNTLEDISFSTAAGKAIQVSNNAMQTAQKLIQDIFNEENKPTSSRDINLDNKIGKNSNVFLENIGCSSIKSVSEEMDVDMDNTLVEKFFEDTLFDEKDLEPITEHNRDEKLNIATVSNTDKNLLSRKPRKSLGGRRSMKYCSSKL